MNDARLATARAPAASGGARPGHCVLRALDLVLAAAGLLVLALPLLLLHRSWRTRPVRGTGGVTLQRAYLALPRGTLGRLLHATGAEHWPVLVHLLRGELALVGPRPRSFDEAPAPASVQALRPGLINPWFVRRRTAVDYGDEAGADLEYQRQRGLAHDLGLLLRGLLALGLPQPDVALAPAKVRIGDVAFDNLSMDDALHRLGDLLDGTRPQQVSFVNPACVNIAAHDRGYRRALSRAALVLPDGIGIKIGAGLLGTPLKQNVNGTDLFPRLCELLQARGARLFLLGGQPGVVEGVARQIAQQWPRLKVVGMRHGYFRTAEEGQVVAEVRRSGADLLLVARGVPAQDLFIDRYLPQLGVRVAMGVGGLFDFVSGRIPRAPGWMRDIGLEWVWRLMQEPGRMWRRYLVGNLTFLVRTILQRMGLRRPAVDAERLPSPGAPAGTAPTPQGVCAVIFAHETAGADLPVGPDHPAALLPLGPQTVVERLMAHLAQAAIADVVVVACERPEALRRVLGDGSRWGLRLRWHLAKSAWHAYGVLNGAELLACHRVLIGHADRCPSVASLRHLAQHRCMVLDDDPDRMWPWNGWAGIAPSDLPPACDDLDARRLGAALVGAHLEVRLATAADGLSVKSATGLLQAQPWGASEMPATEVPGSWVHCAWGALSPDAHVDPGATIVGPVVIGPGCVVERGARVGPFVTLSQDIVVSPQTTIEHCVVLPDTYVGAGLELSHGILDGGRLRHLRLGVETHLPQGDAVLMRLRRNETAQVSLSGRVAALCALAVVGPLLALRHAASLVTGSAPAWTVRSMVLGCADDGQVLRIGRVRCAVASQGSARAWGLMAGLIDIVAGHRCWFGMRPRTPGQWHALRPEWQSVLARQPVGLLHAAAFADDALLTPEACAAADVYAAVQDRGRHAAWRMGALVRLARAPIARALTATMGR